MYFNHTTIMGRLAADPEFTAGAREDHGDDRCWTRLAVNRPGSEDADFFPICAWGKLARVLAQYAKKGKVVLIDGYLRTNNKKLPDGSFSNYTEVVANSIVLGEDTEEQKRKRREAAAASTAPSSVATPAGVSMEDLAAQVTAMVAAQLKNNFLQA